MGGNSTLWVESGRGSGAAANGGVGQCGTADSSPGSGRAGELKRGKPGRKSPFFPGPGRASPTLPPLGVEKLQMWSGPAVAIVLATPLWRGRDGAREDFSPSPPDWPRWSLFFFHLPHSSFVGGLVMVSREGS